MMKVWHAVSIFSVFRGVWGIIEGSVKLCWHKPGKSQQCISEWDATKEVMAVAAAHSLLGTTFELGRQSRETKGRQGCVCLPNGFRLVQTGSP